ncbi:MAG: hypothetical protein AMJ42_02650 [Deltaproteobacteria bacterium DG_8]|nr:MAG: hypothetical protein AMJ42_02650 [Deltaproteobacteria bacterium DG_8]
MAESERPFVILIDTNAMTALSLYVESCTSVKARLGVTVDELKSRFERMKNTKDAQLHFEGRGTIKDGYKLFDHLKLKFEEFDTVQIWFSLLSEIELLDVFLDGTFDHELTRKGIPYRIRQKRPFRTQIDFNYEKEVAKYWEDIKEKLGKQGIEFDNPEKESDAIQDIIKIAKIIIRYVALEPVDLYLYASGIYLRADEIYTHDIEFKAVINKIRTDREWENINKNIQQDLRKFVRSFREECQTFKEKYREEKKIDLQDLPEGIA